MSNRRRPENEPQARPRLALPLMENHKPSSDVCSNCFEEIYKTARKPWRHLHNKSTYCNHDMKGRLPK